MPIASFSSFTDGLDRDQRSRDHFRSRHGWSLLGRPLTALERLRVAHHQEHGLCQTLQNREVALVKSKGLCGENLQHSNDLTLVADGCGHDRANTESPRDHGFDTGITLGVVATEGFSCTYALPGKARVDIYVGSERWSAGSDAGPAHHRTSVDDRDGRAGAA